MTREIAIWILLWCTCTICQMVPALLCRPYYRFIYNRNGCNCVECGDGDGSIPRFIFSTMFWFITWPAFFAFSIYKLIKWLTKKAYAIFERLVLQPRRQKKTTGEALEQAILEESKRFENMISPPLEWMRDSLSQDPRSEVKFLFAEREQPN